MVGKLRSFQESRGGDGKHLNYQQCQVFISNNNIINEFNTINMININTSIIHKIVMLLQKVHCNNLAISWLGNFKDWKISKFLLRSLLILLVCILRDIKIQTCYSKPDMAKGKRRC